MEKSTEIPLEEISTAHLEEQYGDLEKHMEKIKGEVRSPGITGEYWRLVANAHKIHAVLEARKRNNSTEISGRSTGEV